MEAVGDICAMFASDTLKAVGDDYENVEKGAGELYGKGLKKTLKRANGLRNRLVHEYNQLSNKIAYDSIRELLPSLRKFGEETRDWIKNR